MAASPTPRPTAADAQRAIAAAIERACAGRPPGASLAIAFSGGADSSALLLAATRAWPGPVRALHVHHGLQAAADTFEAHCRAVCARLGLPLDVARVDARHTAGESPEDAARRARYAALAALARDQGVGTVWLAQHADDQVETVLLALGRGAGLPGLAGMAPAMARDGVRFERPLLELPGGWLRVWLRAQGLGWVEDPSNADTGLTRNRIRRVLVPALERTFPGHRQTFARSARHAAQAQRLLDAQAAEDLRALGGRPRLAPLRALPPERQANLLRHWLRQAHGTAPTAAQLRELLAQLQACGTRGHRIEIKVGTGQVRRAGGELVFSPSV